MIRLRRCESKTEWNDYILEEGGHPLQLWGWGDLKAKHNWRVERLFAYEGERIIAGAQILIRPLPSIFHSLVYIPRGPVASNGSREEILDALADHAKVTYNAVAITVEPDWGDMPKMTNWKESPNTVLIADTLLIDLQKSETELLDAMSKKTRQYIRKSANEAIEVKQVKSDEDLEKCLAIYRQTADRAGFGIHGDDYYRDLAEDMGDHSLIMAAYKDNQPIAFLWLVLSRSTAFELYGGVDDIGQQLRANYILKWETIRKCKEWGIELYDFNGLLNDGISTFKRGFASHENKLAGTYDKPLSPLYPLWMYGLPYAKKIVRKIKSLR